MGISTHQYSGKEITDIYQVHIRNYSDIIIELSDFIESEYSKQKNISYFLKCHLLFCKEVIEVLKDAVSAIENKTVNENICMRLEVIFMQCAKELCNLQDTDKRVEYEKTAGYTRYEDIYIRLKEECTVLEYCDETVAFVRSLICREVDYSINIYGDVSDSQFQQGTNGSFQQQMETTNAKHFNNLNSIIREEVSIESILREKLIDVLIGGVFAGGALLIKLFTTTEMYFSLGLILSLVLGLLYVMGILGTVVFWLTFVIDLIYVAKLMKKGQFIECYSKRELLAIMWSSFSNNIDKKSERVVGKTYKNIEGKIYRIKYKLCPFCESEPIGKMYLKKDIVNMKYIWRCPEHPAHMLEFDYKKKI